jgi:hypothetical protein
MILEIDAWDGQYRCDEVLVSLNEIYNASQDDSSEWIPSVRPTIVPTILTFTDCHCMNKPRRMSNKSLDNGPTFPELPAKSERKKMLSRKCSRSFLTHMNMIGLLNVSAKIDMLQKSHGHHFLWLEDLRGQTGVTGHKRYMTYLDSRSIVLRMDYKHKSKRK